MLTSINLLDHEKVNKEIVDFIIKKAKNINFFLMDKDGNLLCKNEACQKKIIDMNSEYLASGIAKKRHTASAIKKAILMEEKLSDDSHFLSSKAPFVVDGNVEGVIGVSVGACDQKRIEELEMENKLQSIQLKNQEEVRQLAEQIVHDIHSPLLALSIFVKSCESLSKKDHAFLESAIGSIENITRDLINKYEENITEKDANHTEEYILVPFGLSDIIKTKKYQIRRHNINFNFLNGVSDNFVFIKGDNINFKRIVSNLISTAIESFDINGGTVDVGFTIENHEVKIYVQNNGAAIPKKIIDALVNGYDVNSLSGDKRYSCLQQTKKIADQMNGSMLIQSKKDDGTKLTVSFAQSESPEWITKEIVIPKSSIVIILDDDLSTYKLLENRLYTHFNDIKIKYFKFGNEAIDFINSSAEKEKILLLVDYDLKNQGINGIDVIEKCKLHAQSILVSSCYTYKIKNFPSKSNVIKFLSKSHIPDIPFKVV